MNAQKVSSSGYFKTLQIVHLALMAGVALFSLAAFSFITSGMLDAENKESDAVLRYVVPFFVVASMMASNLIYKQRLKECMQQRGLKAKLDYYRGALIMKYAMIEGPAFFAVIAYVLTGNLFYLGLVAVLLVVFLVNRPTKEKSITDLELDFQERETINDPEGEIE